MSIERGIGGFKMTVGELIDILENFDEDAEVVFQPSNSMYAEGISDASIEELRAFYGKNRDVVVISSSGQEGAV